MLHTTTALLGVLMPFVPLQPALAVDYLIDTATVTALTLGGGIRDTLTVTTTGSITTNTLSPVAILGGTEILSIDNSGSIIDSGANSSRAGILFNSTSFLNDGAFPTFFLNQSSGIIRGGRNGMRINSSAILYSSFINNGLIEGGIIAGTTQAGNNYGIFLNGTIDPVLINTGTIQASGTTGTVAGLQLAGANLINGIQNSGTIQAISNSATGYGINITATTIVGDIINLSGGVINGSSSGVNGTGIRLQSSSGNIAGRIFNNVGATISGTVNGLHSVAGDFIGGVTNAGIISGGSRAIYLQSGAAIVNGLTNSGTLIGAVVMDSGNTTISGDLINSGTITAGTFSTSINLGGIALIDRIHNQAGGLIGGSGITINGNVTITNGLTNDGTIGQGTGFNPISIGSFTSLTSDIINNGLLTSGNGRSFFMPGFSTMTGNIVNNGTMDGNIDIALLQGSLSNTGTIEGVIRLYGRSTITGNLNNTGTIEGGISLQTEADISCNSTSCVFISLLTSQITGGITNSGTIAASDTGFYLLGGALGGGITNSGLISGVNYGLSLVSYATGNLVNIKTGEITGGITNSGTITGATGLNVNNSQITGGITNSGTIEGTGGVAISLTDITDDFDLEIIGGRIIGDVIDNAAVNGYSNITIADDFTTEGNFDVSSLTVDTTKTLTINVGDTFTSYNDAVIDGILTFNVTDTGNFGSLVVSNGTADLTNATLTVGVIGAGLSHNDELRVINAHSALIGGPGATEILIADDSFLWDFYAFDGTQATVATNNTDLFIRAIAVSNAVTTATTPNNAAVATVIDNLSGNDSPELIGIVQNLNNAPTQQAVNDILESTTPTVDNSVSDSTMAMAHQGVDLIQTRLADLRAESGVSTGQLTDSLSIWGQVYRHHAAQDDRDTIAGYSAHTFGFVGGIDTDQLFNNATIGMAFSYGNSGIKSKDANSTRTDIDSYQIGLYGDYNLPQDYFISGSVAYGYNDIKSVRRDVGGIAGLAATSDYSADQYTAHIETGKDFEIRPAFAPTITPTIGATYTHLSPDRYTETGAGGASLAVETDTLQSFELGLGIKSQWDIRQGDGSLLSPSIHAGYRYDIIGDTIQSTSNFTGGGASFKTEGADPARGTTNIGAGMQYKATNNLTLSAGYDFEIRQDYTAHAGIVRAGYEF